MHSKYIQHLNGEPSPDDFVPSTQPWYELNIKRSRWFDLFVAEDRIEAMRGVWGIFAYLMRGGGPDDEGKDEEVGDNKGRLNGKGVGEGEKKDGDDKGETKVENQEDGMDLGGK